MSANDYSKTLYPLQDQILRIVAGLPVDFYLTGGTALSRFHLRHRYSDDLDFFVNRSEHFKPQLEAVFAAIRASAELALEAGNVSENFARCFVQSGTARMKLDFVNDVPFRHGTLQAFKEFPRVDSPLNILTNKLGALTRQEPKDMADILFIARQHAFDWQSMVSHAKEKDLWVNEVDIARIIDEFDLRQFSKVVWIKALDVHQAEHDLKQIAWDILKANANSLFH